MFSPYHWLLKLYPRLAEKAREAVCLLLPAIACMACSLLLLLAVSLGWIVDPGWLLWIDHVNGSSGNKCHQLIEAWSEIDLVVISLDVTEMRGADDVVHVQQGVVFDRILFIHIDGGRAWMPAQQRLLQRTPFN